MKSTIYTFAYRTDETLNKYKQLIDLGLNKQSLHLLINYLMKKIFQFMIRLNSLIKYLKTIMQDYDFIILFQKILLLD